MKVRHCIFRQQPPQCTRTKDVSSRNGSIGRVDETDRTVAYSGLRLVMIDIGGDYDGPSLNEEPNDLLSHLADADNTYRLSLEVITPPLGGRGLHGNHHAESSR